MTTVTTTPPPGIYSLVVASRQGSAFDSNRLTDNGGGQVTIRTVDVKGPQREQQVTHHIYDDLECLSLTSPL